jgi:hypothetical protein
MQQRDLNYVIESHRDCSIKPSKAFRKWDRITPYHIHPIWCATMIATETTLDKRTREEGVLTLLYHDVLEDTTQGLPDWLIGRVIQLIDMMTYSGIIEEMSEIWHKPKEVRLYKLYDKVNNLLDWQRSSVVKHERYQDYTRKLCDDAEDNYGELNITKFARAVVG